MVHRAGTSSSCTSTMCAFVYSSSTLYATMYQIVLGINMICFVLYLSFIVWEVDNVFECPRPR
jgi:hypothetical protein